MKFFITNYNENKEEHKEGDIWEKDGYKWTKKNGIVQNITNTEPAVPLFCPKCSKVLKNEADQISYKYNLMCSDCYNEVEMEKIFNGTLELESINKKIDYFENKLLDIESQKEEIIKLSSIKVYINEFGDVEDWGEDMVKPILLVIECDKMINTIKKYLESLYKKKKEIELESSKKLKM